MSADMPLVNKITPRNEALLSDDMIIHIENPRESAPKVSELIFEFSKVS